MTEHIKKEQALKVMKNFERQCKTPMECVLAVRAYNAILSIPAADVAPVVRGKWLTPKALIECSECGFGMFPDGYYFDHGECAHANESWFRPNYCPQCGARMDGGESNG